MFAEFDLEIEKKLWDGKPFQGGKVNIEDWAEFSGDPLYVEEFQKIMKLL